MAGTSLVFATRAVSPRSSSEDRAEVFAHDDCLVVVVADGAGGVAGGAVASEGVIDAVRTRIGESPLDPYDIRAWSDVLATADTALATRPSAGESTAVVVVVGPYGVVGVSVGDSEAWMIGARVDRLTEHQDRARIGTGRSRPTPFHRRSLEGVLVVATDGLFKNVPRSAIVACCTGGQREIADALVELPKLRSGAYPDDVAFVVVSVR